MISKKIFLQGTKKLEAIYDYDLPERQFNAYYEKLSKDFTDGQFLETIEAIIENEYRFPPVAAFYRHNPNHAPDPKHALYGVSYPKE